MQTSVMLIRVRASGPWNGSEVEEMFLASSYQSSVTLSSQRFLSLVFRRERWTLCKYRSMLQRPANIGFWTATQTSSLKNHLKRVKTWPKSGEFEPLVKRFIMFAGLGNICMRHKAPWLSLFHSLRAKKHTTISIWESSGRCDCFVTLFDIFMSMWIFVLSCSFHSIFFPKMTFYDFVYNRVPSVFDLKRFSFGYYSAVQCIFGTYANLTFLITSSFSILRLRPHWWLFLFNPKLLHSSVNKLPLSPRKDDKSAVLAILLTLLKPYHCNQCRPSPDPLISWLTRDPKLK